MNYIHFINWFWEEVPQREGYKSEYVSFMFAVVDSINRNQWQTTSIEYERLQNKAKLGKRMYYEAIKWLSAQELLVYKAGRNEYSMATFSLHDTLKAEVQKRTSMETLLHLSSTSTTPQPAPLPHLYDTSTAPSIDKQLNTKTDKQENIKTKEEKERSADSDLEEKTPVEKKKKYRDKVTMTEKEYKTLVDKYGEPFTEKCLDTLHWYKASNNKTYKDDYATMHSWVIDKVKKENPTLATGAHGYGPHYVPPSQRKMVY